MRVSKQLKMGSRDLRFITAATKKPVRSVYPRNILISVIFCVIHRSTPCFKMIKFLTLISLKRRNSRSRFVSPEIAHSF